MGDKWELNKEKMQLRLVNIVTTMRMIATNNAPEYKLLV